MTPEQPDPPDAGLQGAGLLPLVMQAGIDIPAQLIERHERAMSALLQPGADAVTLPDRIDEAGRSLQQVYVAFLAACPSRAAAPSVPSQHLSSWLMGQARLINHIHHHQCVPEDPQSFLRLTQMLPPSRLERRT